MSIISTSANYGGRINDAQQNIKQFIISGASEAIWIYKRLTNGVTDSAFAKLPVPSTPMSQWFDRDSVPYKFYYPPAERMRRLKFRFRYHNGRPANFGTFNFSFMLEFTIMLPMILRDAKASVYPPPMSR